MIAAEITAALSAAVATPSVPAAVTTLALPAAGVLAAAVGTPSVPPEVTTLALSAAALAGWLAALALFVTDRRRAELVARAVHEIAGPLNAAGLALHVARREGPAARLAAIDVELRRAGRALEDLDAARAGRRARDRARAVDVGALLAQQALAWQGFARSRGASLRVAAESGLVVRGDAIRLAQALGNLIANAIEHGGQRIELRASAAGERVRVEVRDDGPGLPAPVPSLIRRARGGRGRRGRGLAITADVAARHGGRLASAPAPAGARLVLDLPAFRGAAAPDAPTAPHDVVARPGRANPDAPTAPHDAVSRAGRAAPPTTPDDVVVRPVRATPDPVAPPDGGAAA
jgi:signal transduction histidine kinase